MVNFIILLTLGNFKILLKGKVFPSLLFINQPINQSTNQPTIHSSIHPSLPLSIHPSIYISMDSWVTMGYSLLYLFRHLKLSHIWLVKSPFKLALEAFWHRSNILLSLINSLTFWHSRMFQAYLYTFPALDLETLFFYSALVPSNGKWYLKIKIYMLSMLTATEYHCF